MNDKFIQLLVGNKTFVVSKATLLKDDRPYFATLVSENPSFGREDIIHINRDGTHFQAILNHLSGFLDLNNWKIRDLLELAIEAKYYKLTDLEEDINFEIEIRHYNI